MKKLMMAVAIVCAAALSQAATIDWKSGTAIKTAGEGGAFTTTTIGDASLMMYAFVFDSATSRDAALALNGGDVWASYAAGDLATAAKWKGESDAAAKGSVGAKATVDVGTSWSAEAATSYYAITILTYDADASKTGPEWYIANSAESIVNTAGTGVAVNNLAKKEGGLSTGANITGWTEVIPEPTSGLLLLIGMGALALRRRQA